MGSKKLCFTALKFNVKSNTTCTPGEGDEAIVSYSEEVTTFRIPYWLRKQLFLVIKKEKILDLAVAHTCADQMKQF